MGVRIINKKFREQWVNVEGAWFDANWWTWRATVDALRQSQIIDDQSFDFMSDGVYEFERDIAMKFAAYLREHVLPQVTEGSRMLTGGTITTEPDDFVFHRAPEDQHKNYSVNRSFLEKFMSFLESSEGIYLC